MEVVSLQPSSAQLEIDFLALPHELVVEIVKNLSCADILRARKVSKSIYYATKSLVVWRHVTACEPRQWLWLERPIETYTMKELEYFALRRHSVEIGYDNLLKGTKPHQRRLPINGYEIETTQLVPGGRWLLVATTRGGILYYDLQAEDNTVHILIPQQLTRCRTLLAIEADSSSPYLKFNLASWITRGHIYPADDPYSVLRTWKVTLLFDEEGRGVGLKGECLSTMELNIDMEFYHFILSGKFIGWAGSSDALGFTRLSLCPWKAEDCTSRRFSNRALDTDDYGLGLLPNSQLFFLAKHCAVLHTPVSTPEGEYLDISIEEWMDSSPVPISRALNERSLSNIANHEDSSRFVVLNGSTLQGIIIDSSHEPRIRVVPIVQMPNEDQCRPLVLSDNFVLAWSRFGGLVLRRFAWKPDFDHSYAFLDRDEPLDDPERYSYHLDSASGRVIVEQSQEILIQSFAFLPSPVGLTCGPKRVPPPDVKKMQLFDFSGLGCY